MLLEPLVRPRNVPAVGKQGSIHPWTNNFEENLILLLCQTFYQKIFLIALKGRNLKMASSYVVLRCRAFRSFFSLLGFTWLPPAIYRKNNWVCERDKWQVRSHLKPAKGVGWQKLIRIHCPLSNCKLFMIPRSPIPFLQLLFPTVMAWARVTWHPFLLRRSKIHCLRF